MKCTAALKTEGYSIFAGVLLLLVPVFKRMLKHHRLIDPAAAHRADAEAIVRTGV